jgi:hypothetical protein
MRLLFKPARALRLFGEGAEDDGWRMAFAWGETRHANGDFRIDEDFAATMIASFAYMRDTYGYYPPIAAEHAIEIEFPGPGGVATVDGITYGIVTDIEARGDGIWVFPRYNALGRRLADDGAFLYVSPSFYPEYEDPHSGRILLNVMREFTQCARPHQKNLKTPAPEIYGLTDAGLLSLSEDGFALSPQPTEGRMAAKKNAEPMVDGEIDEKDLVIAELQTKIAELELLLAEATAEPVEEPATDGELLAEDEAIAEPTMPEGEVEPLEEELTENSELRGRVAKLERQLALSDAVAYVQGELPGADIQTIRDLAEMKLTASPTAFVRWMDRAKSTAPGATTPEHGRVGGGTAVENSDKDRKPLSSLVSQAKASAVSRANVIGYCTRRGYELAELDSTEFYAAVSDNYDN